MKTKTKVIREAVEIQIPDWDAYWVLDFCGNPKEWNGNGILFDKEEYPNLQNALDAFQAERARLGDAPPCTDQW